MNSQNAPNSPAAVIEITISPTGQTTVQTRGFVGPACRDASRAIERALGIAQSDMPTAEMYQGQEVDQSLRQTNG